MQLDELMSGARDVMSAKRVYGDPYEKDGLTVIPAVSVRGGGGTGAEGDDPESAAGSGFGVAARPSGAWIIENGDATWKPAVDVNRIVLGGQIVAMTAIVVVGRILLMHARHGDGPRRRLRLPRLRRRREARRPHLPQALRVVHR
jgi:uncharacterized spore protein YtfJ